MILPILFALVAYVVAAPQTTQTQAAEIVHNNTKPKNTLEDLNNQDKYDKERQDKINRVWALYENYKNNNDELKRIEYSKACNEEFTKIKNAEEAKKLELNKRVETRQADETQSTTTSKTADLEKDKDDEIKQGAEDRKWQERASEENAAAKQDKYDKERQDKINRVWALYEEFINRNDEKRIEYVRACVSDLIKNKNAEKAKNLELNKRAKRQADETESTTTSDTVDLEKEEAEEIKQAAEEKIWQERASEESAAAEQDGAAASVETDNNTEDGNKPVEESNEKTDDSTPGPQAPDEDSTSPANFDGSSDTSELDPAHAQEESDVIDSANPEVINVINDVLTPVATYDHRPLVHPIAYVRPIWRVYRIPQYVVYRDYEHYIHLVR